MYRTEITGEVLEVSGRGSEEVMRIKERGMDNSRRERKRDT